MSSTEHPEAEIVLRLSDITKKFGPLVANDAISLSLKPARREMMCQAPARMMSRVVPMP